jgi:Spy/CpxP family protein refolding chaperone
MKQYRKSLVLLTALLLVLPVLVQAQDATATSGDKPDKQEMMAKLEKMSAQLNLTPAQKKEMAPIMMDEASKMKAIKANASLGPLQKAMQMKQVGTDMDAKVKPILTPDQYQKFEQMRAQEREEMMEKMRSGKS